MNLTKIDQEIMELSRYMSTGGIDLFWNYWSAPIGATADQAREDLILKSVDQYDPPLQPGQFVPMQPLPWASEIAHGDDDDIIIVGGIGSGKTLNMVMVAGYFSCMLPNFRYLGTAPIAYQSDLSYKEFLQYVIGDGDRRISRWIERTVMRPYPTIYFVNGSTMEFRSLDRDATSILTWSGDMITVDQAESDRLDLEEIIGNLGTRLRGQVGGRARLGKLVLMANSAYNPLLWETFDRYEANEGQKAIHLTSHDNPTLTEKSLKAIERRFADKSEARRMMLAERPLPKGKEFTAKMIQGAQSESLDNIMSKALDQGLSGFDVEVHRNVGTVVWHRPPEEGRLYIMAGDPGQANPPYRNSPPIMVFDVTNLPRGPAELVAFDWVYGNGSYIPFVNRLNELYEIYMPYLASFDATGTQKSFDDLEVLDQEKNWWPLNFSNLKPHMVLCAKVLLDRGYIKMPKSIHAIWNQLLMWHEPDKNLQQDIASVIFMIAYMVNQILPKKKVSEEEDQPDYHEKSTDRFSRNRIHGRTTMRSVP